MDMVNSTEATIHELSSISDSSGYAGVQIRQVESGMQNKVFEHLQQVRNELERSRKEASEGRKKADLKLFETSKMFKTWELNSLKAKREVEEILSKEKGFIEKENLDIFNEQQKINEYRAEAENKLLQINTLLKQVQQLQGELQRHIEDFASAYEVSLTEFSYSEIKEATNNFDKTKEIRHDGRTSVYRGFLHHTIVAIKKFNGPDIAGEKEFNNEVEILCRMRHPNIVALIGVCRDPNMLVYEFLPNGSLEDHLQCKHNTEPLPWRTRIRIAADICTALVFLHSNKPSIAHGDLKPDNVLLDAKFGGKLWDFGISRSLNLTDDATLTSYHRTDQIKGTLGYMDPEYIASGEMTAQYDVYSFGVILLRLLTGMPLGLQREVKAALSRGVLHEILDTSAGHWPPEYTEEFANLALKCCDFDRKNRPDLAKEVWPILQIMMNGPPSSSLPREVPSYFICPITQEIMQDPQIATDGFTYEGHAIREWIHSGHRMSPMTYLSFRNLLLTPNIALRFAIEEWQNKQQQ